MQVLVIGGGGREHALAWKVAQSPKVRTVFVAPGNAGTAHEPKLENVTIAADDIGALASFAHENAIALAIVGPEVPLALGVVDAFTAAGLRCFGPVRAAAQLESSKTYAKDFLARHHIPTAAYCAFTDIDAACTYVASVGTPIVIKADGLAAGKGVVIAQNEAEATSAIRDMLGGNSLGSAGRRVVIEEFLVGEEVSFIVMADGSHALPLATAQDHKARDNGDRGPNTGGMGAYSPAPVVTPELHARILREVIEPTLRGMASEGNPYTGFLYAGLMIAQDGSPRVLEFNCRLGDPEAQPILMRLRSDLVDLCNAALDQRLHEIHAKWDERAALGVVLAAGGYPGPYRSGDVIHGLDQIPPADSMLFHAGTQLRDHVVTTAGGRVLCACALGDTVGEAQRRAYTLARLIHWNDMYYRTDIGHRAIAREVLG
ncbi:MAG: phosphoribosylamine--glycine ligase [Gammaproteobacteria bacterium]|nr:phosphoribosylamine--glycine ligase [Gammaproteobacteria bacterium]